MNFRFVNANGLPFFLQKQHLLSYFFLTKNNLNQITLKKSMKKDWTREELETDIIGKMKAVTIPVNISFKGKQKILDMSELGEILRNAKVISKQDCYCRKTLGNCIEPMDGCISIDDEAIESIEKHGHEKITVEEALQSMKRTYDAGLVHMGYTFSGKDKVEVICSCCSCCCHTLSAAVRFGYSNHAFSSKFITTQNSENCKNCGICVKRCQFHAREIINDIMVFDKEKCFGCGVCLQTCTENAIELIKRDY